MGSRSLILHSFARGRSGPPATAPRDRPRSCTPVTRLGPGAGWARAGRPRRAVPTVESGSPPWPRERGRTMRHLLSPQRVAAVLLGLGLTLAPAGPASAQATDAPPASTASREDQRRDHTDWGWLGLLGLLGLAGLMRRDDRPRPAGP